MTTVYRFTRQLLAAGLFCLIFQAVAAQNPAEQPSGLRIAPAPLYRDPIYDGAADPTVVYHPEKKEWWMFYTQRRANQMSANVGFCYGTGIGIAVSADHGKTWVYKGNPVLEFEEGVNTFWAPDIILDKGVYHMFVAYIRGVRNDWGGKAVITHYTSKDLWHWQHEGPLKLSSDNVIDPTFLKLADGKWHIWYKDDTRNAVTMTGESGDLKNWKLVDTPAIGGKPHEGPKAFRFKGNYWMITDEWAGQRVYRSDDALRWERQGMVLDKNGVRREDSPTGAHADVVVVGEKAYIFYFTHPGRKVHFEGELDKDGTYSYSNKRTSIQVAELVYKDGTLVAVRDEPFDFYLP
ncbi:family 43 glycosylhydrolase [Flavihumibacter petaseus]|uniref:Putative glycosidase n=1 Tax=Flavihumibacter petaseus NBRC 106054 TaxID=1220578 RepID=A0A0E9MVP2_9BACT|nr:family 43 glycosylhydrolase [Flavihumibacter petaseus]GAO41558.1 putative glycosidase [Flavihumibacter petaseus NBRC 106054]